MLKKKIANLGGSADGDVEDVIIGGKNDDSYPYGTIVITDTCVWENMIVYIGLREVFTGINESCFIAQGLTEITDIF
jgi:hypothetical protein